MSRGRDIRGMTIEIGGDTTGLQKAFKNVNTDIKTTQAQLKDVNSLLKLDPTNTELLQQKQKLLSDQIGSTKEKLEALKQAESQVQQQFQEGKVSQEQYDALKREIIATEESLKSLEAEAKNAPTQMQQSLEGLNSKIQTTQTELKEVDKLLKLDPTNTELLQQKQRALSDEIGTTKEKLALLKEEEAQVQQKFQEGKVSQEQYDALKRTIIETEQSLKELENTVGSGSATLAGISTATGEFGDKMTSAGEKMLPVTATVAGIGTAAVKTAADFDSSMSNVQAISGSSAEDMEKLRERAREMGAQTKFSAKEAGDAMSYMAMAGWDATQMYDGLPGIMNLAAASGEDLATTSDIVTDALTAFGMKAENSSHFADVLAKASSSANTNVGMMGETFKYVAPVAGSLGYNAEDTAVAIGLMANSGIKASQAGTQLRSSLTNMIRPSKDVGDSMERWGFYATETAQKVDQAKVDKQMIRVQKATLAADKAQQAYNNAVNKYGSESTEASNAAATLEIKQNELTNANETLTQLQEGTTDTVRLYNKALQNEDGSMKSLKETMDFLRETMGDMTEAEQTQAATAIFGKEAMSGMLAIINASDKDYQKLIKNIDNCDGAAADMAETMQDNLSGQITQLQSALQELAIAFGTILMPYIRKTVEVIQGFVKKLNGMSTTQKKIVAVIAMIVAAIGPLLITIGKMSLGISTIAKAMSKAKNIGPIVKAITKIKGAVKGLFTLITAHPVIAIITVIITALVLLYTKCEWFRNAVNALVQGIIQGVKAIPGMVQKGINDIITLISGLPEWWSGVWKQISDFFVQTWQTISENPTVQNLITTITTLWQNAVTTLQTLWNGLAQIAQGAWELLKNVIVGAVTLVIGLVSGNFEKLKEDTTRIWTNIKDAASLLWTGIKDVVSTLAKTLVNGVVTVFTGFRDAIALIWNAVSQVTSRLWNIIASAVSTAAGRLRDKAVSAISTLKEKAVEFWDNIRERAEEIWSTIKDTVVEYASNMKEDAVDTFRRFVSGIKSALSGVYNAVVDSFSSAIGYITGLPEKGLQWGADFVEGIAQGIRSAIGKVTSAVSDVAGTIKSWLHFSRPDEGPLHYYEEWMPDFMKGLADGIKKSRGMVTEAMKEVQTSLELDMGSVKVSGDSYKNDFSAIANTMAQILAAVMAGQDIRFDDGTWAGKLTPKINRELALISGREGRR